MGSSNRLQVSIYSQDGALHWDRRFNEHAEFKSVFVPVGHYPDGYWLESTGALRLRLGVSIVNGGWHWQHRGTRLWRMPLPKWLAPRTVAYKEVRNGMYHFHVELVFPLFGRVLSYGGSLGLDPSRAIT